MVGRMGWILIVMMVFAMTIPATAAAQHGDISDNVRFEDELNPNEFMLTGRFRAVAVPNFILGMFFDEHASHWSDGQRNFSYGGEFVWRRGTDFELGVAFDYADLTMPEAFWKETGDDPQSAEWTEIDLKIYSLVFTAYWFWDVQPWLTPYLGGGIGLGFTGGDIVRYDPNSDYDACYGHLGGSGETGFAPPECYEQRDQAIDYDNPNPEENVWPVYPMVNLTTGVRFNIHDHGVLKIEGGIHPYAFVGTSFGAQF